MAEFIKEYGKIGMLLAFLAYILVFTQNSLNSQLIKDSINYNLIYSYEILTKENLIAIHIKNNGIKSLKNIRIKIQSHNNNIQNLNTSDSINFKSAFTDSNNKVLKTLLLESKNIIYPSERISQVIPLITKDNYFVNEKDFSVSINTEQTNGIKVKNVIEITEINYNNINLYLDGNNKLFTSLIIKIILPIIFIIIFILILYKLVKKTKIVKEVIRYFEDI